MMIRKNLVAHRTLAILLSMMVPSMHVAAQTATLKEQLVGTWA
ncbi:exported protein of unknown function (plasmid) [Caballeronia sp. S22]